ncbi:MAG: T9SS type A sorting domain-containing protein [Bacteroidaceae bacterium]|nr:T9SS type A sorting domain-containing protein [Bacteroidaceae bacterium]
MKKITLLQSALALIAAFMLALPARAQVASAADLFGTYKFTADVNVTDAGQALKDNFKSECEVVITKCSQNIYDGEIQGLAGATAVQKINDIDLTANTIKITNPNGNYDVWGGKVYMANAEGAYPFEQGNTYSEILYTFDPATKTITLPNFTLVTCDHANSAATIAASFTNAKLTLVEAESVEVTDLSGDWHFTAATGGFNTMEDSTLPTEFDMTLTATDDNKKAYNISLTLGDFAPLALTATFDGVTLTIPFNEHYFDAENKIGLVNMYGEVRPGTITFNMANENLLTLTSGMTIAQDSISPEVKGGYMQWYMAGSAKRQGGETEKVTWEGTYKIKAGSIYKAIADYDYPEEFDMVVTYNADYDIYLVTEFFGNDVTVLNNGGISFKVSAEDPNKAEITTTTGYLKTIVADESYLTLKDLNFSSASNIVITRQADGTYTLSDFSITYMTYDANWQQVHTPAAIYQQVTAEKEPEATPFTWASTFTVKVGSVDVYKEIEGYEYPKEFEMEVTYNADNDMYFITKFFGNDVVSLNNGGIRLTPSTEDPNKAEIATTTGYLKTIETGVSYLTLKDINLSDSPIALTHNGDGTVTISDFSVSYMTYDENWKQQHASAAKYKNVTASVVAKEEEPLPTEFTWADKFTVKAANVTVYKEIEGYEYPKEFEMEVTYNADHDMYLITKFFGNDVVSLNNGGIRLTPSTEDPNKAEIATTTGYVKTIVQGESYLTLKDINLSTSPITLTHNGDGTVTISDFSISYMTYDANWQQLHATAAKYEGVSATSRYATVGIENIEAAPALKAWSANGTIYVAGEAQAVEVYDMSGRTVFSGVASQVGGLNKGLYLVKVKNAVAKVAVK